MFEIYALTDTGRVRSHNEDCFMVNRYVSASGERYENLEGDFIVAVADGMGGENAGEFASRLALDGLCNLSLPITNEALEAHIRDIHGNIVDYGKQKEGAKGLGTTLTGIICVDDRITTFNVGDSRVYRFRDGMLKQLTRDHSLVQMLFEAGQISRDEIFGHPQNNILVQSLGGTTIENRLQVDIESIRGFFEVDDVMLLCSDGLSDIVREEEIEGIFQGCGSIVGAATKLVERANENGGHDNITVIGLKRLQKNIKAEPAV